MAASSLTSSSTNVSKRDKIFVAAVPLRATKGLAKSLMSTAYSLNLSWDLQHFMVIIKSSSTTPPPTTSPLHSDQVLVFDFQPKDPENVCTALAALSGREIPGSVFVRKLTKLPGKKCWLVGTSKFDNAVDVAYQFNTDWSTELLVGHHDCRHYTNGLVELLVGEKYVLDRLRRRGGA